MSYEPQINKSVDGIIPLGYDSRQFTRFVISGGGYVARCKLDNIWFDTFRPALRMHIRDISIQGAGLLGETQLRPRDRLIIPSPQGYLMHASVIRCVPDPLFPKLYRIGLLWCKRPPAAVFSEWESFILVPQLPDFHEQLSILSSLPN